MFFFVKKRIPSGGTRQFEKKLQHQQNERGSLVSTSFVNIFVKMFTNQTGLPLPFSWVLRLLSKKSTG